ncbi:hypothetical protein FISHEDRAFT_74595 [Fistulina hepatica ATCC 64428]|uniref:Large ribosomal subunit protein mL59 domain-containing protein n=1 Tax=Fistulina hepatica ATCC 64428 TaxID=1128425 RepID=A0A0D7A9Y1_9AGAR|nr:hypothetical protein FISHEDRAFT_74595 [Fistulina hepatica ATCC 64428]
MASSAVVQAATNTIRNFVSHEMNGVSRHVGRFGDLPRITATGMRVPNPFIPWKSKSGHWQGAKYSLRRQADLVKTAKAAGLLHLLPPGPKCPNPSAAPSPAELVTSDPMVAWVGEFESKEVKGAEIGTRLYSGKKRMFKGHKRERVYLARMKKRAVLLRDMDKRIHEFKTRYKKRNQNPLKPRFSTKAKLPF